VSAFLNRYRSNVPTFSCNVSVCLPVCVYFVIPLTFFSVVFPLLLHSFRRFLRFLLQIDNLDADAAKQRRDEWAERDFFVAEARRLRDAQHSGLIEAKRAELINARRAAMAAAKDGEKPKAAKGPYDAADVEQAGDDDEDAVLEFTDEEIERMVAEDEEATEREVMLDCAAQ
jgi:hypothetical protein